MIYADDSEHFFGIGTNYLRTRLTSVQLLFPKNIYNCLCLTEFVMVGASVGAEIKKSSIENLKNQKPWTEWSDKIIKFFVCHR